MTSEGYVILSEARIWNKKFSSFPRFWTHGGETISEDQVALQFKKVSFLPVGAFGNTPFGRRGKFLSISMSHSGKNIIKNKMANQRKES